MSDVITGRHIGESFRLSRKEKYEKMKPVKIKLPASHNAAMTIIRSRRRNNKRGLKMKSRCFIFTKYSRDGTLHVIDYPANVAFQLRDLIFAFNQFLSQ